MYVSQEHGSPYLHQHVPVVVEETMAAGVTRARNQHECALEILLRTAQLGPRVSANPEKWSDEALRRFEAGMWLRRLYHRCKLSGSLTMCYDVGGRDKGEMSDEEADRLRWNQNALRDTYRALRMWWTPLRDVCGLDHTLTPDGMDRLLKGLDALADHRGI
jgi:hypothetical protein